MTGSEHNDEFYMDKDGRIRTKTNRSGGIQVINFNFERQVCFFIHHFQCVFIHDPISIFRVEYQMEKSST